MSAHCKSGVDKLELTQAVKLASKVATLIPWPMLGDASKSWKLNSRSSKQQVPCLLKGVPTQKKVPGCPRSEQPGLFRTAGLSGCWT